MGPVNETATGMALLVVLLLLAVMVTMASSMTQRFRMEWQRTYNQQLQLQNYWYLLGSEALVAKELGQDLKDNPKTLTGTILGQRGTTISGRNGHPAGVARFTGLFQSQRLKPTALALMKKQPVPARYIARMYFASY